MEQGNDGAGDRIRAGKMSRVPQNVEDKGATQMALNQYARTQLLIGEEGLEKLHRARVAIFGIGGVGAYCCEALIRSGVMTIDLFDDDRVSLTNLNRQLIALHSTVGRHKVDVMADRLHDINPEVRIVAHKMFYLPENADEIDLSQYDYVVDAVDTVTAKLELITRCTALKVPIISAMGAGNKLDPGRLQVSDIHKTSTCPLARIVRAECRRRGIRRLKVVFSTEEPIRPREDAAAACREQESGSSGMDRKGAGRKDIPGSVAFVPAVMGMMMAAEIVKDLLGKS